jgi:hypothetical protein
MILGDREIGAEILELVDSKIVVTAMSPIPL